MYCRYTDAELDRFATVLLRAKMGRKVVDTYHVCTGLECNPQNESSLLRKGILNPVAMTGCNDIYICDKGGVHVCTRDRCNAETVCHISGCKYANTVSHYSKGKSHSIDQYAKNTKRYSRVKKRSVVKKDPETHKWTVLTERYQDNRKRKAEENMKNKRKGKRSKVMEAIRNGRFPDTVTEQTRNQMREGARALVYKILFDNTIRRRLNADRKKGPEKRLACLIEGYRKDCSNAMQEICSDWFRIFHMNTVGSVELICELKKTPENIEKAREIIDMIMHAWEIICKYGGKGNRNAGPVLCCNVTLATLYQLQEGVAINGHEIFKKYVWLLYVLPYEKELKYYQNGLKDKDFLKAFRTGKDTIRKAFETAIESGASDAEICFEEKRKLMRVDRLRKEALKPAAPEIVALGKGAENKRFRDSMAMKRYRYLIK